MSKMPLPDAALEMVFQYGLCASNLMRFSSVCRRWQAAAQAPICWAGKQVFIEGMGNVSRNHLSAWLLIWRSAERVHLTYSQMDLLGCPLNVAHAIVHLWQGENHRVRQFSWRERDIDIHRGRDLISTFALGFWSEISIGGDPWLACMTAQRAPDEVILMREELDREGVDLWAPLTIGWTSASRFGDLADACSNAFQDGEGHGSRISGRIFHAVLVPDLQWEATEIAWAQSGMPGRPPQPPLYYTWGQNGARVTLCTAQLDRVRGAIRLTTGPDIAHAFRAGSQARPITGEMRFFVAMPDNRRTRRHQLSHPHRDFVELPAPFLASSFRPASAP